MDQSVTMAKEEWDTIIRILVTKEVWIVVNPILMKMQQQLQQPHPQSDMLEADYRKMMQREAATNSGTEKPS